MDLPNRYERVTNPRIGVGESITTIKIKEAPL